MTSNAKKTLDQAINEIENEWGYEGIKEKMYEIMKPILKDLERLEAIDNAKPSEALERLEEGLNTVFDYAVQSTLDNLLLRGYDTNKMLKQECLGDSLEKDLDRAKIRITDLKNSDLIKQALLKAQEKEKENARLKEILINGFRDKNGAFHKQTYLAFVDDEWCICDLKTDEWFLVKEVLKNDK